ncbi:PAQR family membrane homeostasis protein TrhA [Paenibacillus apiarius]|uniref:Hemolysin III family protein n=1 Tax=Paenibacillus apiarius TaxID=46240 RepID=A0ABT4DWH7_9BACL|nr:hemolysin III family protein [Paenibacillus apiarius]MCY9516857.1 hemolysin III family protein [Paenibacillus apiarius]MCY9521704.1 hemolysin III family protein [Paenibacillus apiarius]MCY9554071.1 hemolysin III family protein [Paenibacillus apiarius]MCY9558870.1 hemolysin III family protein [Paenibacillus apiarius]MCY9683916.1 hemolysin III family protein [Paenibacillus apiarius]
MANTHTYSRGEEIANAITHGVGVVLSVAALTLLIVFAALYGDPIHVVSFIIYGISMLLLYTSSTLVHSFPEGKVKDLFETFDHASIYLFIAGTYTPLVLIALPKTLGWTLFAIVWALAAGGVVFKAFFTKRFLFISTLLYIGMGWLIVWAWEPLSAAMPAAGLTLLVTGGILYTVGTIFYVWRGFPFHHMIWHLFVLGGSAAHFFAVLSLVQIK